MDHRFKARILNGILMHFNLKPKGNSRVMTVQLVAGVCAPLMPRIFICIKFSLNVTVSQPAHLLTVIQPILHEFVWVM